MTHIVLHGGYSGDWENAGEDRALFQILIDAAVQADNRLMIGFLAKEKPSDFLHLNQLLATFNTMNPDIKVDVAGQDNFRELLPQHKVLFLQGGNTTTHQAALANISKDDLAQGKTLLAGSSSGAMLLCKHGYSRRQGLMEGKGIVDLALIPHANVWPVEEYLPTLRQATTSSIVLLNEMQMIELNV